MIVGPIVASRFIKNLPTIPMNLLQPTGLNNNDTSNAATGTALVAGLGAAASGGGAAATSSVA
jgi:1,3-beta-glucan synthase